MTLVAAFGSRISGWLGLLALGAAAWASFYIVRAVIAVLTPEEQEFLQRLADVAATWSKRRSDRKRFR